MISLLNSLYPGDDATLLVFNVLIQITAVILLTMLAARRFLRRSPAAGHAAWLACLAFVVTCPLITFAASRAGLSIVSLPLAPETSRTTHADLSAAPSLGPAAAIVGTTSTQPRPATPDGAPSDATLALKPPILPTGEAFGPAEDTRLETAGQATPPAAEPRPDEPQPSAVAASTTPAARSGLPLFNFRSAVSIAVVIWAAGALLFAVRLLHGGLYLRTLRRTTTPLEESAFVDVLTRVRRSLGVTNLPPILLAEPIAAPVVAGLLRPTILLPALLPETITRNGLHDVLVHECAHVVRRDHRVGVLQRLVEAVYWPHPLVHHMNRQLARCREEVCDNHVLSGVGAADYADTLLDLTVRSEDRVGAFSSIGMFGLRWPLEDRVRGLLDRRRDQSVRLRSRWRLAMLLAACVVLAAAATLQIGLAAEEKENKPLAAPAPAETTGLTAVKTDEPAAGMDEETPPAVDLTYTGTIRDETTNEPIPGATVVVQRMLLNPAPGTIRKILEETKHITDERGQYTFTVRKEHASVRINGRSRRPVIAIRAMHPDYVQRGPEGYSLHMLLKNEKLGGRPFFEDFKLRPGKEVTGVVEAPDGAPLAGVPIKSYFHSPDPVRFGGFHQHQTDRDGRFRMTIPAPGGAVLWILPKDYAPIEVIVEDEATDAGDAEAPRGIRETIRQLFAKATPADGSIIKKGRGDLGVFEMKPGLTLKGRLLDEHGKPVAGQLLQASRAQDPNRRHRILGSVGEAIDRYAKSDADGNVTFDPLPPGQYRVEPRETDYTPFRGDRNKRTPIQGVFHCLRATLNAATAEKPFTLKAVPAVKVVAQSYDSSGKKTTGQHVRLHGREPGGGDFWQTYGTPENGRVELLAPRGLEDAILDLFTDEHSSLRFQKSADDPLWAGRELKLGTLENDLTDVRIVRYVAPVLLVKPTSADGNPLESVEVTGRYADTSIREFVRFEEQKDGRHRSWQLLPDEECTITVTARGYRPQSRTVSLAEGTVSELAVKLDREITIRRS